MILENSGMKHAVQHSYIGAKDFLRMGSHPPPPPWWPLNKTMLWFHVTLWLATPTTPPLISSLSVCHIAMLLIVPHVYIVDTLFPWWWISIVLFQAFSHFQYSSNYSVNKQWKTGLCEGLCMRLKFLHKLSCQSWVLLKLAGECAGVFSLTGSNCSHFAYISVRLLSFHLHISFCLQMCIISPTDGYDLEGLSRDRTDFWFAMIYFGCQHRVT